MLGGVQARCLEHSGKNGRETPGAAMPLPEFRQSQVGRASRVSRVSRVGLVGKFPRVPRVNQPTRPTRLTRLYGTTNVVVVPVGDSPAALTEKIVIV